MADRKPLPGPRPDRAGQSAKLEAEDVAAYLASHPDFLAEHAELLAVLTPPENRQGRNVVDLQHFMLLRMQDEVARLKAQQRALIATSRANLSSQQRVHAAILAVIGAGGFDTLVQTVTTDLAVLLDVDVVTLCIEAERGQRAPFAGVHLLRRGGVAERLGPTRDARLADHVQGDPEVFGDGAGLVQSHALLRLPVAGAPPGLLALGSRRPTRFRPGHGTELLCFLARTLGITIGQWLDI